MTASVTFANGASAYSNEHASTKGSQASKELMFCFYVIIVCSLLMCFKDYEISAPITSSDRCRIAAEVDTNAHIYQNGVYVSIRLMRCFYIINVGISENMFCIV